MTILLIIVTTLAAMAIAHYAVLFLEPPKASWWRAVALVVVFAIGNNLIRRLSLDIPVLLHWALYIAAVAGVVWFFYRLKPLHNFTVAGCYVVGRFALVYFVSLLPLEKFVG
jgi:hypothetical protein